MAEGRNSHIGEVVLGDAHRGAIAALEAEVEGQRDQIRLLTAVVDEVADVKDHARALIRRLAEREDENEMLQSELDDLQQSYDELLDEMVGDDAEEPKAPEASENDRIKKEFAAAQDDARRTIDDLNGRIAAMGREITRERNLREEASGEALRLTEELLAGKEEMRRKERELEGMSARAEECNATKNSQIEELKLAEASRSRLEETLNAQIDRMKDDFAAARDDAQKTADDLNDRIASMEREIAKERRLREESRGKVAQLGEELLMGDEKMREKERELREASARAEDCRAVALREKSQMESELRQLNTRVREYKTAADNESESNRKLQSDLRRATAVRDDSIMCISNMEIEVERLKQNLVDAETAIRDKDREAKRQIERHEAAMINETEKSRKMQLEAAGANAEVEKIKADLETQSESKGAMQSDLERVTVERDDALRRITSLEGSVGRLRQDMADAENSMQEKHREAHRQMEEYETAMMNQTEKNEKLVERLIAQAEECKIAMDNESDLNRALRSDLGQVTKERDEARGCISDLESEVHELRQGMADAETAMQEKDREIRRQTEGYEAATKNEVEKSRKLQLEVEQLIGQVEECKLATDNESELSRKLQSHLEQVTSERDEALRRISNLESGIGQLRQDMADAESANKDRDQEMQQRIEKYERAIINEEGRSRELQLEMGQLSDQANECRAAMDNESELNRALRSDLERATSERDEAFGCISDMESKIDHLKQDLADAETALQNKDQEFQHRIEGFETAKMNEEEKSRKLQSELERMNAQVEECKVAIGNESELSQKLQCDLQRVINEKDSKINQLSQDMADAETEMQDKDRDMQQRMGEYEMALINEKEKIEKLQSEVERLNALTEACKAAMDNESELNRACSDFKRANSEKDEVLRCISGARRGIKQVKRDMADAVTTMEDKDQDEKQQTEGRGDAEKSRELQLEVERLTAHAEELKAIANNESERNRTLQSDLERVTSEKEEAMECISNMEGTIDQLKRDMSDMMTKMLDQDHEGQIQEYEEAEKSGKLQLEVERLIAQVEEHETAMDNEEELTGSLQSDLDQYITARGESLHSISELTSEIEELSGENAVALKAVEIITHDKQRESRQPNVWVEKCKVAKTDKRKENRILQLDLEGMATENDRESNLRDEALPGRVEPENKINNLDTVMAVVEENARQLESKIDQLNQDTVATDETSKSALEDKDQESRQLISRMEEYTMAASHEAENSRELQMELERANARVQGETAIEHGLEFNRTLRSDLEQMTSARDEFSQSNYPFSQERSNAGKEDTIREVQQLNVQVEGHDVARDIEAEKCRLLQEEALREKDELEVEVDNLNQIIAVAEEYALELESKIDRLHQEIGFAKDNAEAVIEDKNQRLKQLDAQVDEYKMSADNAASLNKTLRIDLDLMTSERDKYLQLNSEMKKKTDQLSQHLAVAEKDAETMMKREDFKSATNSLQMSLDQMASERDEALRSNSELNSEVDRLRQGMDIAEKKANEAMKNMEQEMQQLKDHIIEEFKASTELHLELQQMASERDEALQCNYQLKRDIDNAEKKANEAMKGKDEEIQQLKNHVIEEFKGSMDTSIPTVPVKKRGRRPLVAESRSAGGSNDEISVHSNGSLSSESSRRQTNGRLGSLFSRFGPRRNVTGTDVNSNDSSSEGIIHEMDQTDIDITKHVKLKNALESLMKEKGEQSDKITTLQAMVEDLESTVSLQATQEKILKEMLSSLQDNINDMETHEPTRKDSVGQLKARTLTLEPIPQLREDKRLSKEEARKTEVECRDPS